MSALVISADVGVETNGVFPYYAPIIETKFNWEDEWAYDPEIELMSLSLHASSTSPSVATFKRRYGNVKTQYEADFSQKKRLDFLDYWVRVSFLNSGDYVTHFVGKIQDQATSLYGGVDIPAGAETWQALDGLRLLSKISVSQSVFLDSGGNAQLVDWIPAMNKRDKRGFLVGNATSVDGSFFYGVDDVWSHLEYVNYLVENFIQQYDSDGSLIGPIWSVGGATSSLDGMETTINFGECESVTEMLRKLIPIRYGLDFQILPTDDGYEINVFSLVSESQSVDGVTMPGNPNTIYVDRLDKINLSDTQLVESKEKRFDEIRVIGKRIVVCGTLSAQLGELVPKWSNALEAEYIAAAGAASTDPEDLDKFRARDRFKMVYQQFGAPQNWDMGRGVWSVQCDLDGNPVCPAPAYDAPSGTLSPVNFQTSIRETLSWIPLREGFDYTTDPPTDNTTSGVESEVKSPMVWVYDALADYEETAKFVLTHEIINASISVHAPLFDWGICLNASPNHLLARTHWTSLQSSTSDTEPRFDWETLIATIAIESDHRVQVGYRIPDEMAAGDGSIMHIYDDTAEMWVMLPHTAVDTDVPAAHFLYGGSRSQLTVLRNDADRLKFSLAGAVSRYILERTRAAFKFKGVLPWGYMMGYIMTVVQSGDDSLRVGSPITSMEFHFGESPETIIKTGYA